MRGRLDSDLLKTDESTTLSDTEAPLSSLPQGTLFAVGDRQVCQGDALSLIYSMAANAGLSPLPKSRQTRTSFVANCQMVSVSAL